MRDPARVYKFMAAMCEIWQQKCPDLRFGQMMSIMQTKYTDTFYMEEDEFLAKFTETFGLME